MLSPLKSIACGHNSDHFWITIGTGAGEPIRVRASTHSRQKRPPPVSIPDARRNNASTWAELRSPVFVSQPA